MEAHVVGQADAFIHPDSGAWLSLHQVTQPGQFKRKIKDNWSWLMFGSPLHTEHQLHAYSRSPTIASIGVQLLTWINTLIINYKAQCMPHDERQSKASLKYRRLFLPGGGGRNYKQTAG